MDTRFSPEDDAFRAEVAAFFDSAYDQDLQDRLADLSTFKDAVVDWQKRLYAQGWIAPNWPAEYGGPGWNHTQKFGQLLF